MIHCVAVLCFLLAAAAEGHTSMCRWCSGPTRRCLPASWYILPLPPLPPPLHPLCLLLSGPLVSVEWMPLFAPNEPKLATTVALHTVLGGGDGAVESNRSEEMPFALSVECHMWVYHSSHCLESSKVGPQQERRQEKRPQLPPAKPQHKHNLESATQQQQ